MVSVNLTISGVLAIIVGVLILIWPKILNIAVGLYLLIIGILNILNF
jgi:uncharacterized membrane protein HdeD (DUF308 family)